ncbi:hypothetical protein [Streptomyces flavofungini]|uniref:hypothetical protein n=1 Tax=Streptomyces flavofungini TaxID=68200 RepID=UPI0034DEC09E
MNKELETFITTYLDLEQAPDVRGNLRPTLHAFSKEYVDAVRVDLASVLRTRSLSVADYERLTDIEFADTESLYNYLGEMYEYLFEDRQQQPAPPE